jgi:transcriptional regulator with GAF, ATPase, and Fis domain
MRHNGDVADQRHTVNIGASGATTRVPLKLVVLAGPDVGCEVALSPAVEIGADPACELVLKDPAVSRRHARISIGEGAVVVSDQGSRNGTFVGETRIREAELAVGAIVRVGKTLVSLQPRWQISEVAPSEATSFGELLGESLAMRHVFALLERVSPSDATVLVEGESGTGKELVARSIHAGSPRASGPYVVFDCSAVPSELVESELFGHKRGAFSGATSDRAGAFQRAHKGTLCLDELGELPLDLQPKLLRAIENREVRPVGEDAPRKVDVRIVATTNRDLSAEVERGRFRADLLYRLEVVRLRMPPLRGRPGDIPGLVARLLDGKLPAGDVIEGENLDKLRSYPWPGNVRELRNALLRAVTLGVRPDGTPARFVELVFNLGPAAASPTTLGREFPGVATQLPYKEAKAQLLESFDRTYLAALLSRHPNNILRAAEAAGLSRKHVYELIKRVDGKAPPDE